MNRARRENQIQVRKLLQTALPALFLLGAGYLLFANTFAGGWLMDDFPVIVENPDIRSVTNFLEDSYPGRPLREVTYLLDYAFFGLDPAGYHIQNIFWHGLNAWLVLLLIGRLGGSRTVAWTAALLFLVHPVTVEVVANASHRKDSLALTFILLSMLAYMKACAARSRTLLWVALCLVSGWLAFLAKQNAAVLPLVFLAYESVWLQRGQGLLLRSRRMSWLVMATGLAAIVSWAVYFGTSEAVPTKIASAMAKMAHYSEWTREIYFLTVLKGWAFMALKLVWPAALAMEYSFPVPRSWADPWVILSVLGTGAAAILLLALRKRSALAFFALAWAAVFWLPTSNLFYPLSYFAADRYLYAPLVGFCALAAILLEKAFGSRRRVCAGIALVLIAVLSGLTWQQNEVWGSPHAFYSRVLRVNPESKEGLLGMGLYHRDSGNLDEALAVLQQAEQKHPFETRIYHNIGTIYHLKGDLERSRRYLHRAVELDPENFGAYSNLGSVLDDLGEPQMAIDAIKKAIALHPRFAKAYLDLGIVYERMGRYGDAEKMQRRSISERPDYGEAYHGLGVALYRQGRLPEAAAAFESASQMLPEGAGSLYSWGSVSLELGDPGPATQNLSRLRSLDAELAATLDRELRTFRQRNR